MVCDCNTVWSVDLVMYGCVAGYYKVSGDCTPVWPVVLVLHGYVTAPAWVCNDCVGGWGEGARYKAGDSTGRIHKALHGNT